MDVYGKLLNYQRDVKTVKNFLVRCLSVFKNCKVSPGHLRHWDSTNRLVTQTGHQ